MMQRILLNRVRWGGASILFAVFLTACGPCTQYCEELCACEGQQDEACVEGCLAAVDVYSEPVRDEECNERLDDLRQNDDECVEAAQ